MVTSTSLSEDSSEGTFLQVVVFSTIETMISKLIFSVAIYSLYAIKKKEESNILVRAVIVQELNI